MNIRNMKVIHHTLDKMIEELESRKVPMDVLDLRLEAFEHDDDTGIDKYTQVYVEILADGSNDLDIEEAKVSVHQYDTNPNSNKTFEPQTFELDWSV